MPEQLQTLRFGPIGYNREDVLHFPKGIPGFEELKRFVLVEGDGFQPFKFLQSVDNPHISLPLLDPRLVDEDYQVKLPSPLREELELEKPEDALVLCVVTLAAEPTQCTVNLFAPVIINHRLRRAAQVLLLESSYPVAQPLLKSA